MKSIIREHSRACLRNNELRRIGLCLEEIKKNKLIAIQILNHCFASMSSYFSRRSSAASSSIFMPPLTENCPPAPMI